MQLIRTVTVPDPLLSDVVRDRMDELELTAEQLALAAGLHKTTVYRIVKGDTKDPHAATLRKLARALGLSITDLTQQIEPRALDPAERFPADHPLAQLLLGQLGIMPEGMRLAGASAAASAMLDVEAGLGQYEKLSPGLRRLIQRESQPSLGELKGFLLDLFVRIPRLLQRTAVREAVRAMIDVQLRLGEPPSAATYRVARDTRLQPTPSFLVKRQIKIWQDGGDNDDDEAPTA